MTRSPSGVAVGRDAAETIESLRQGVCVDCGLPIPKHQLADTPPAPRCVRCESERERLRAQPSAARR